MSAGLGPPSKPGEHYRERQSEVTLAEGPTAPRILLIDDDESVRTMLRHVLARGGYEVETAVDGVDGLNRWRGNSFDLVVTDLFMPEDGLHMMRQMLQDDPAVRIIAMSGGGQLGLTQLLVAAGHLGARKTLKKPFPPKDLLDAVAEVLAS